MRVLVVMFVATVALSIVSAAPPSVGAEETPSTLPILHHETFDDGMERWETTDPDPAQGVWRIDDQEGNRVLRLTEKSTYQPPVRSPHSIALLKDVSVGDFVLTGRMQVTSRPNDPHRDLCLFWGYQDPSHFYYVHFGEKADPHACQIFIVDGAPRKMITVDQAPGTPWTAGWHRFKIVRRVADGTIEVYFDDLEKPLMTARDKTFAWGRIGVGSFDNHGNFDDVELRGVAAAAESSADGE